MSQGDQSEYFATLHKILIRTEDISQSKSLARRRGVTEAGLSRSFGEIPSCTSSHSSEAYGMHHGIRERTDGSLPSFVAREPECSALRAGGLVPLGVTSGELLLGLHIHFVSPFRARRK
jgi:hypothetical protein